MPFLGTIVNFVAVLVFGILGAFLKKGISKRVSDAIMSAMAICVIYIGIDGILEAAPPVPEGALLSAGLVKILIMIISMAIGTLIGELLDIDSLINKLGDAVVNKMDKLGTSGINDNSGSNFSRGFVSCSLLFCVGAMAVNGAIQDALGDPSILFAKSVIDAISCFVMATNLGIGCAFSAFLLLLYQGTISVLAYFLASFIPAATITYMSVTGSLIIILIGTNVLGITRVKTANMVPAMFVPIALAPLFDLMLS